MRLTKPFSWGCEPTWDLLVSFEEAAPNLDTTAERAAVVALARSAEIDDVEPEAAREMLRTEAVVITTVVALSDWV